MNTTLLSLLAQSAPPADYSGPPAFMTFVPLILMFVAFYFLLIAPQRKRLKEHQKMVESLDVGDDVITVGGIFGKITGKKDRSFMVRIADGVKVEVLKSAIQTAIKSDGTTSTHPNA